MSIVKIAHPHAHAHEHDHDHDHDRGAVTTFGGFVLARPLPMLRRVGGFVLALSLALLAPMARAEGA